MNSGIEFAQKINLAYNSVCKPLLHKFNLPQTAFDILMFLANNPEYTTARDIVEVRKIKANLVSVNVDRLVCDGYIIRKETKGDRRKTQLICTPAEATQVGSLADEVEFALSQKGIEPISTEGFDSKNWVLLDYSNVIVHVFVPNTRTYYDLEHLWADGEPIDISEYLTPDHSL